MAKETVQVHLSLKLRLLCMPSICDLQFEKKKKKKKKNKTGTTKKFYQETTCNLYLYQKTGIELTWCLLRQFAVT